MSTMTNPFTMTPAVMVFCSTMRALRDRYGAPITNADDPRFVKLLEDPMAHTFGPTVEAAASRLRAEIERHPALLGHLYLESHVDLPTSPFPAPSWAETVKLELEGRNEASSTFRSKWFTNGRLAIVWEQIISVIYADSDPDTEWEPESAGDIVVGEVNAQVYMDGRNLDLPVLDAMDLNMAGELLIDAARLMDGVL